MARLRTFMMRSGAWNDAREDALLRECAAAVELAAEEYLAHSQQFAEAVFDHVYAKLPADLIGQRDAALSQRTE